MNKTKAKPVDTFTAVLPDPPPAVLLKLDLGAGPNPREGFEGVDRLQFDGKVRHVVDLREPWPWPDSSVEEAHTSHFVEHLERWERVHFFNELYRVLTPGGKCTLIVPHWASCRAYGDPSHCWPPFSEFAFYYLSRAWRLGDPDKGIPGNAPHVDIKYEPRGFYCDFEPVWGWAMHQLLTVKSHDAQQYAFQWFKEAVQDVQATLTSKKV